MGNPTIQKILRIKRDGGILSESQIQWLIKNIVDGTMEDSQLGSFLMAVFFRGLTSEETGFLTKFMAESGFRFEWPSSWVVGDKHSTGGVGDKVSLILAPALAANGLKVPMVSGRGLSYSGGTLDKLESIPGFKVSLKPEEIRKALETVGCCIVGQTESLVPADRRMYATRDITSTVESMPLIVSSILSKKCAEGLNALVLDVKFGCGSFQPNRESADNLATALVEAASRLQLPCTALISDMNSPLGDCVGNSLEVEESIDCLKGKAREELTDLVCRLGGELLFLTKLVATPADGYSQIRDSLNNGKALETFHEMIICQGVSASTAKKLCYDSDGFDCLPKSTNISKLVAKQSGYIKEIDGLKIAMACQDLGSSRKNSTDQIRYGVGVKLLKTISDPIEVNEPWIEVYHDFDIPNTTSELLSSAIKIQTRAVEKSQSRVVGQLSTNDNNNATK